LFVICVFLRIPLNFPCVSRSLGTIALV
jgi:hypothetical protein